MNFMAFKKRAELSFNLNLNLKLRIDTLSCLLVLVVGGSLQYTIRISIFTFHRTYLEA